MSMSRGRVAVATPRYFPRPRMTVMAAALIMTTAAVSACGTGKGGTTSSSGGAGFFAGKTITFIAPDKAGGTYDLYGRLFAPALGKILHATVNVENVPGGGTIIGTDQMVAAQPDGLTIGNVNIPGDIGDKLQGKTALKVDLKKLGWIGQPAPQVEVWVTPEASHLTSWNQVVNSHSQVTYGGSKSGVGWLLGATSMRAWKIPTKFETGYPTLVDLSQGVVANEFQLAANDLSGDFYSDILSKKARPLMVSTEPSLPGLKASVAGVPTLAQEMTSTNLSGSSKAALTEAASLSRLGFDFATPPGVSADKLAALRKAFAQAAQDPSVQAQAKRENLELAPITGSSIASQIDKDESDAAILAPYMK